MKFGKFSLLLTKRLYRKPLFLAIVLLIPLLTFGYSAIAKADSGFMTIALAQKDPQDSMGKQIIEDLMSGSPLIRFLLCETPEEARELVVYGKADSAWIFDDDLQNKICAFVANPAARNAFVQILEREQSVTLLLTHEKLSGLIFTYLSPEIYLQYIRKNIPELAGTSDAVLMEHYHKVSLDDTLFTFATQTENPSTQSYLLTPVRGLLAVVTLLCGLSSAMFYIEDVKQGLFSRIPIKKLPIAEFLCQMITVGNIALIATVTLFLSGLNGSAWKELGLMFLYIPCVSLFAMVLRRIFPGMRALGIVTPLLVVVAMCACPVFLDLIPLRTFALLLPPTYFIRGAFDAAYIGYMVCHCAVCAALSYFADKLFPHK